MEEVDISLIVGILITMVFSAFFSGMEIAFVSSNRMLAEMDKEKNGLCQRLLSQFYNQLEIRILHINKQTTTPISA